MLRIDEVAFHFQMLIAETAFLGVGSVGYVLEHIHLADRWYLLHIYRPMEDALDTRITAHRCSLPGYLMPQWAMLGLMVLVLFCVATIYYLRAVSY